GSLIFAAYRFIFNCNDSLKAEIHAIMQGMTLAIQHSTLPVIVQSDSSEALLCLSRNGLLRSAYGHLVAEIKELMRHRE
uniref:RNase H type-1 domain-containing protein n=1 Tax=Aegilops tauschii subsp. strangulata TaxID=200361 RepID=A0A452Z1P5_AEGTS